MDGLNNSTVRLLPDSHPQSQTLVERPADKTFPRSYPDCMAVRCLGGLGKTIPSKSMPQRKVRRNRRPSVFVGDLGAALNAKRSRADARSGAVPTCPRRAARAHDHGVV